MSHVPAAEIFENIHTVMHLYRSQQYRALRDEQHDLTHMEDRVLSFFARHPGATLSELVNHSGRDKAQMTRLIQGLRSKGLLEARIDQADRRSSRLRLTPDGEQVQRSLQQHGARVAEAALAGLPPKERELLAEMLMRVKANLEETLG